MGLGGAGRLCLLVLLGCAAPCASVRPLGNPEAAVPLLSREGVLAHSAALPGQPRRLVIATFSDFRNGTKQAAMVASWARNLQALRLPCVVGLSASGALTRGDVAALLLQGHCGVFRLSFASNACEVNAKVCRGYVAQQLGGWGLDLLYTDADVALLRDPLPYLGALLLRHPAMDLATSSDSSTGRYGAEDVLPAGAAAPPAERRPTAWQAAFPGVPLKQGYVAKPELASEPAEFLSKTFSGLFDIDLEYPGNCNPHQYNTGVMFVRATDASAALLAAWIEVLEGSKHDPRADDQLPLNVLLKTGAAHCSRGGGPPAGGEGLLNLAQFSNGFTYAMGRNYEGFGVAPFTYHATYTDNKVFSLQEQGAFWGGAAARRAVSAGRFLVLDLSLNESALHAGHAEADAPPGHYTWQDNYYFVQHQLRQFRAALALARATRRTLVLPRFAVLCQCFFYRPEGCVISGLRVRLPHVAPTAHVLRVDRLAAEPVAPPTALDDAPARWRHPRAATPAARLAAAAASAGGDGGGAGAAAAGLAARRVVRLDGGDLLAAAAAGVVDTSAVSDSMLGAWCCVKATDYPEFAAASGLTGDADARVRYGFDGPPRMVPAASPDVGKCSV